MQGSLMPRYTGRIQLGQLSRTHSGPRLWGPPRRAQRVGRGSMQGGLPRYPGRVPLGLLSGTGSGP